MKTAISQLINSFLINYLKKENILAKFFSIKNATSWTTEVTQALYELTEFNNGVTIMKTAISQLINF